MLLVVYADVSGAVDIDGICRCYFHVVEMFV